MCCSRQPGFTPPTPDRGIDCGAIACILVTDFPLAALLRAEPALVGVPLVISASHAAHAETLFVSAAALKQGVRAGMTLAQARMMSAQLVARPRSAAAEQSAMSAPN